MCYQYLADPDKAIVLLQAILHESKERVVEQKVRRGVVRAYVWFLSAMTQPRTNLHRDEED